MKTIIAIVTLGFLSVTIVKAGDDGFTYFWRPKKLDAKTFAATTEKAWMWKPTVHIPAVKVIESSDTSRLLDAYLLASAGGGLTYQFTESKKVDDVTENYALFSASLIFLLNGKVATEQNLDLALGVTVGGWNNLLELGVGYDFGTVINGRSRVFGLLSIGLNLTNN
ncbi:MAG: hypothetical protein U0Y96_05880 [Candidatus Kapaibacterium sp.]